MIEKYLIKNGWMNIYDNIWVDLTMRCSYECCEQVAVLVQNLRDQYDALPWYKKIIKSIFNC